MNAAPKRHHWWPQLQSGHWTDADGLIHVVRPDGSFFKASPQNVGVEGGLYTRYELTGQKDLTIERWFSEEIENPFVKVLEALVSPLHVRITPLPERRPDKEQELRELGFIVPTVVETLHLRPDQRRAIDAYLAALLVRNPRYLAKIARYHEQHGTPILADLGREKAIKTVALENMLYIFELYQEHIGQAHLGLLFIPGDKEFIFSDAGITAQEPWRPGPIPFDIHAPLTPKIALEVLPVPDPTPRRCFMMRINNRGVARMNRLALQDAERFVFCKSNPPTKFIQKYFGKTAPNSIGFRWTDAGLETKFDRVRDKS